MKRNTNTVQVWNIDPWTDLNCAYIEILIVVHTFIPHLEIMLPNEAQSKGFQI